MKLNIKTLLLALIISLGACDVIDLTPESDISDSNFWKTITDAQSSLTGVYNGLQTTVGQEIFTDFVDFRSDDVVVPVEYGWSINNDEQERMNQISPIDAFVNIWSSWYLDIARANNLIAHLENITLSDAVGKNRILGEAYFLRALFYFYLVRDYGDCPILTKPTTKVDATIFVKRDPEKEVYDQIISDLNSAITLLQEPTSIGKTEHITATEYAAKSLLCNVYLERAYKSYNVSTDFSMAAQQALDVIQSGKYQLVSGAKYGDIFTAKYSTESIFEVDFNYTLGATNMFKNTFYPRSFNKKPQYGGGGLRMPSKKITEQYEPGDLRTSTNFQIVPIPDGGVFDGEFAGAPYIVKYPGTVVNPTTRQSDSNFIIYRLSDVMLMRAEALAKGGIDLPAAINLLNGVRTRAGLPNTTATTADDVFNAIQKERLYELCFEGKRWYDLVRTGLLLKMRPELINMIPDRIYYPIPQNEVDKDPNLLPQNPTY